MEEPVVRQFDDDEVSIVSQKKKKETPWGMRVARFIFNPCTYLTGGVIFGGGIMVIWYFTDLLVLAKMGMILLGSGIVLAALASAFVLLYSFGNLLTCRESAPVSEYLSDRASWSPASKMAVIACFLVILMICLTITSPPFITDFFTAMHDAFKLGLDDFSLKVGLDYLSSPEFLEICEIAFKFLFVITPFLLLDTVGRIATAGKDYDPDEHNQIPDSEVVRAGWESKPEPRIGLGKKLDPSNVGGNFGQVLSDNKPIKRINVEESSDPDSLNPLAFNNRTPQGFTASSDSDFS